MRLTGSRLTEFKAQGKRLRDSGLSYAAIGRLYGITTWTARYHLYENAGAVKRQQMVFYNYMKSLPDDYGAINRP